MINQKMILTADVMTAIMHICRKQRKLFIHRAESAATKEYEKIKQWLNLPLFEKYDEFEIQYDVDEDGTTVHQNSVNNELLYNLNATVSMYSFIADSMTQKEYAKAAGKKAAGEYYEKWMDMLLSVLQMSRSYYMFDSFSDDEIRSTIYISTGSEKYSMTMQVNGGLIVEKESSYYEQPTLVSYVSVVG